MEDKSLWLPFRGGVFLARCLCHVAWGSGDILAVAGGLESLHKVLPSENLAGGTSYNANSATSSESLPPNSQAP